MHCGKIGEMLVGLVFWSALMAGASEPPVMGLLYKIYL